MRIHIEYSLQRKLSFSKTGQDSHIDSTLIVGSGEMFWEGDQRFMIRPSRTRKQTSPKRQNGWECPKSQDPLRAASWHKRPQLRREFLGLRAAPWPEPLSQPSSLFLFLFLPSLPLNHHLILSSRSNSHVYTQEKAGGRSRGGIPKPSRRQRGRGRVSYVISSLVAIEYDVINCSRAYIHMRSLYSPSDATTFGL
jgi:hypothetical protein